MADYYTNFSFKVPLTEEQWSWTQGLFKAIRQADAGEEVDAQHKSFIDMVGDTPLFLGVDYEYSKDEGSLWIHDSDGAPNLDLLAPALQQIMKHFDIPGAWGFQWAGGCTKHRLDAFGGGACVVTKDEDQWINTGNWLSDKIAKLAPSGASPLKQ